MTLSDDLQRELEEIVRGVSKTWPVIAQGICSFCGSQMMLPGPCLDQYEALRRLTDPDAHLLTCVWSRSRKLLAALRGR